MMRTIRRVFVSMAAQMLAPFFGTDMYGNQVKYDDRIDPRAAIGKRSSLRRRNRSRYMPHHGGGMRALSRPMTDGDYDRLERAAAKRVRKATELRHLHSIGAVA
jgi:hypothetical protein